jgi:hypothetical protein
MLAVSNVLVAAILLWVLGGQPAATELATRRTGFSVVSAGLGDGWFAPESHGRQRWAWSRGDAVLHLHSTARKSIPLTLRFALRSLSPRRVSVRLKEQVLWEGPVAGNFVPVELRGLVLPPGTTTLRMITDAPGRLESSSPGARTLGFALYGVEVR